MPKSGKSNYQINVFKMPILQNFENIFIKWKKRPNGQVVMLINRVKLNIFLLQQKVLLLNSRTCRGSNLLLKANLLNKE
jgi:hypothetical protein